MLDPNPIKTSVVSDHRALIPIPQPLGAVAVTQRGGLLVPLECAAEFGAQLLTEASVLGLAVGLRWVAPPVGSDIHVEAAHGGDQVWCVRVRLALFVEEGVRQIVATPLDGGIDDISAQVRGAETAVGSGHEVGTPIEVQHFMFASPRGWEWRPEREDYHQVSTEAIPTAFTGRGGGVVRSATAQAARSIYALGAHGAQHRNRQKRPPTPAQTLLGHG